VLTAQEKRQKRTSSKLGDIVFHSFQSDRESSHSSHNLTTSS